MRAWSCGETRGRMLISPRPRTAPLASTYRKGGLVWNFFDLEAVMRGKLLVGASVGFLVVCLGLRAVWSQEKQDTPKAAADAGDFTKLHAQWTTLIKELRDVQIQFRTAAEKDREALRT